LAETAFGFLDQPRPRARQRIDKPFKTTLVYPLGETFVELELDWREQAAFVLVGWCRDGEIPDGDGAADPCVRRCNSRDA
jgi:hypothetical protein